MILLVTVSLMSPHPAFADDYEKSQIISQTNECGNYWFPVNIICSNLNSQAQGEENNVAIADFQLRRLTRITGLRFHRALHVVTTYNSV